MNRLFLRLYLLLGLVLLLGVALVFALQRPPPGLAERDALLALAEFPPAAVHLLTDAGTMPEQATAALAEQFGHPVALAPRPAVAARLQESERLRLDRGETVAVRGREGVTLYTPLPGAPFVAVLGPVSGPMNGPSALAFVLIAALLLVALGAGGVVRPLERDLRALSETAQALGRGNLLVRARLPGDAPAGALGHTMDEMADRIQALLAARQDLMRAVSHELRTPLQRLRFAVELLPLAKDEEDLEARISAVNADIDALDELVAELLEHARLEAGEGKLRLEEVDLDVLVADAVEKAGRLKAEIAVTLRGSPAGARPADRRAIDRLLANLLSNAVRYARTRVEVTTGPDGLTVDDDGPGVPEADRARVFEPFVRLDEARVRDTGGVGLGLALAARIAAAHEMTLCVEEAPIGGARLRLAWARSDRHASVA